MRSLQLKTASGYTLIEVLVAVVVLSIGLLGMANMQLLTLRNNTGSYLRSQAAIVATDLADRIHANAKIANSGGYVLAVASPPTYPGFDCKTAACTTAALARADLYQWYTRGSTALPGFRASVSCTPSPCNVTSVETITVMWDELDNYAGAGTGCSSRHDVDLFCYRLSINP